MGKCGSKQAISDFPEQSLRVKLCSVGIGSAHLYHWLALQRHITANTTEEIKFDGFRALAYVEGGKCRLVSRRGNDYKSFHELCKSIADRLNGHTAVLDGGICCLDQFGRSQFH